MFVLEFKSVFAVVAYKLPSELPAELMNFIFAHTTVGFQILKIRQCDHAGKFWQNSFYIIFISLAKVVVRFWVQLLVLGMQ